MSYDSRPDTYEHIGVVREFMTVAVTNLLRRANAHDRTKLEDPEREAFDRMTPLLASLEYGTDEYRASLRELGPALQHHYEHNRHHPEFHARGIEGMSLLDMVEMLCDWKAASLRMKKSDVDFMESISFNQERFGYSDELRRILENTAQELGLSR